MSPWIIATVIAAFSQNLRFMLQKHLKTATLSTGGATFARFLYSAPIIAVLAIVYAQVIGQGAPTLSPVFWGYALVGGVSQITATMCVVALFTHRNFGVGITFKKTEVLMAVGVGALVLGEGVSLWGFGAILIGLAGVLILSDPPGAEGRWIKRIWNRAAGLGLASGLFFAISGVAYRGATLQIDSDDAIFRALVTLACVTSAQTIGMAGWLAWRERGEITRVLSVWRVAGLVGLTSMVGSVGWFIAFSLQTVAYVKALGQIELVFSFVASVFVFKESVTRREIAGVILVVISVLLLILVIR